MQFLIPTSRDCLKYFNENAYVCLGYLNLLSQIQPSDCECHNLNYLVFLSQTIMVVMFVINLRCESALDSAGFFA